jgi:hypothetical protein
MSTFIPHGSLTLSNHGGLEIELYNEMLQARLRYYGKVSHWQFIKCTNNGIMYVTYYGRRYKLDQFMKV